jgi:ubiquitin carboxyl-terminal hydrolase 22/27/51
MSVILQSFVHNPLLRNFYLSDGHHVGRCMQENCLSCGMDELFQAFYSQDVTTSYAASKILSDCWLSQQAAFSELAGYDEHDAHEFFQFLAEELHRTAQVDRREIENEDGEQASYRTANTCDCIIHQTFYGKLQSNVTCQHCGGVTTSVEPFLDLSLGIDNIAKRRGSKGGKGGQKAAQPLTLQRCLDEEYMQSERCEYSCRNCDSPQEAKKQLKIKNLPNVLCIQFKVG